MQLGSVLRWAWIIIAESAVCLVKNPQLASGGIWTTAPAMGAELIDRLQANAGLTFTIES